MILSFQNKVKNNTHRSNMKKILFIIILLPIGLGNCIAQTAFEKFRAEMTKIETQEREYMDVVWGKNDYSKAYKDSVYQHLAKLREDKLAFAKSSIDANRNDKQFVWVLNVYVQNFLTLDELEAELKKFTPEVQQTKEWQEKMDFVKYARLNLPGQKCANFTVKDHQGKEIHLYDILKKNKLVFIDFWASWCGACRATMPHLVEIYPAYKEKGVEFLSVSLDEDKEAWDKAYKEEAIPWQDGSNLLGWKDPIAKKYALKGIPHKILIASDGTIIGTGFYGQNELEHAIDEYLHNH